MSSLRHSPAATGAARVARIASLFVAFVAFASFKPAAEPPGTPAVGSCPAPFLAHDYDPVGDAVVSWTLKPGEMVGQSFTIPAGRTSLSAFRVKLIRTGPAPRLIYRIGLKPGAGDLAEGTIEAQEVPLFFERWIGRDFQKAVPVKANQRYYLQVQVAAGPEKDGYELFGTASEAIASPAFNRRYQYLPQWEQRSGEPNYFENPINVDYGTQTPRYPGGAAFGPGGEEMPALDFAFQFSAGNPVAQKSTPDDAEEERFAFVRDELLSPVHSAPLVPRQSRPAENEVAITREWSLLSPAGLGIVARTALDDFQQFMRRSLETPIKFDTVKAPGSVPDRRKVLVTGTSVHFPDLTRKLTVSESFSVQVRPDRVIVCGSDERGLMRGLHHLEDLMRARRGPFLPPSEVVRAPLYTPRITTAPFYSTLELELAVDPYTDEFLSRISHFGFNGIWVWADLFKVGHSDVYPELDQQVALHQERLRAIVERAGRYGIDVFVVLAYHPLPDSFFVRHPESRGTPFKAYGGDNVLCTSNPPVRQYIREATADTFLKAPGLHGVVFIVGGEGFIHCYTRNMDCPRCSKRSAQEVIAEFTAAINEGARSVHRSADVVLWPYSASNWWSRDDKNQSKLIEKLPRDVTFMTEFGKEGLITFGDTTIPAYDYPISYLGPSERFVEQASLTERRGLPLWVKTEHAIALEAIQTPCIPVFSRWAERFRQIDRFGHASGVFANWMHYGFMPSIAAEVAKSHTWSPLPDSSAWLREIAGRDFGSGTEEAALEAWQQWSSAITHYPFSSGMAMGPVQKGPAHPLFFSAEYQPLHGRSRQFKNDLSWTRPWGVDLVITEFQQLVDGWQKGVNSWDRVIAQTPPELKRVARREGGVGRALLACFRSTLNVGRFYKLRDQMKQAEAASDAFQALKFLDEMEQVARKELENAREALPVAAADSRLGYANSAGSSSSGVPRGGIYSPGSIRKKIQQVERMLNVEIPAYRAKLRK